MPGEAGVLAAATAAIVTMAQAVLQQQQVITEMAKPARFVAISPQIPITQATAARPITALTAATADIAITVLLMSQYP
jgi:hypothetical protein